MGPWRRGSASRSQREGRGFESRRLHQTVPPVARLTRHPCGQTLIMHWKKRREGPSRPDGPVVAQPPRKRQVAGSNPARGSREASARLAVRRTGRPGARRHGRLPLRRWCNGKHGGLQNRRSGFESRPACERNVAQLAARAAGGREAAGSSPAIPTWENPARPSLPAWGRNTPHGSNAAVQGPVMRRGGRMRTPDTKGAHHVRSGRT